MNMQDEITLDRQRPGMFAARRPAGVLRADIIRGGAQRDPEALDGIPALEMPPPSTKRGSGFGIKDAIVHGLMGAAAARGNTAPLQTYQQQLGWRREDAQSAQERLQALQDAERERFAPQKVGGSLIQLGPDGEYRTLYDAPQPFELYAEALGHQPGSEDYRQAIEDYRLNEWSAPALSAKRDLEDYRFGHRRELQDDRLNVTIRGQDMRAATTRRGQDMTDSRVRARRPGGSGTSGGGRVEKGDIVRNPTTGERRQYLGDGKWKTL